MNTVNDDRIHADGFYDRNGRLVVRMERRDREVQIREEERNARSEVSVLEFGIGAFRKIEACFLGQIWTPGIVFAEGHLEVSRYGHVNDFGIRALAGVFDAETVDGHAHVVVIAGHEFGVINRRNQVGNAESVGNAPRDNLAARLEFHKVILVVKIRFLQLDSGAVFENAVMHAI